MKSGEYLSMSNPHMKYSNNSIKYEVLGSRKRIDDDNYNFLFVSYDENNYELLIKQDIFGSPYNLYYCTVNNIVYFSSSLKILMEQSGIKGEMNYEMIDEFVQNGFISSNNTLLLNVYKLMPNEILHINKGQYFIEKIVLRWPKNNDSKDAFFESELSCIKNCNYIGMEERNLAISLSAGYDSNLILNLLYNDGYEPVIVSVGEKSIHSETDRVKNICNYYNYTNVNYSNVSEKTLMCYSDIVERLEGSVFEPGIFLQYELAKTLAKNKCTGVLCGECADQVFNCNFFSNAIFTDLEFKFGKNPFELASCLIIKKSGIMLNSFGLLGYYPYCSEQMIGLAAHYRNYNGKTKELHKAGCMKIFPSHISKLIKKQGGSSSLGVLFSSEAERKEFIQSTKNDSVMKYVSKACTKRFGPDYDYELLNALCIRYLELFKNIFCHEYEKR